MPSFFSRLFGSSSTPPARVVRGIPVEVVNSRADIDTEDVVGRLDEALALIAQYQPHRFRHLARDVRVIRIERFPTRGAYMPADRSILTELTFLARRDITAAPVASSILHEGVHARVAAFRARVTRTTAAYAYGTEVMAREERLCRRSELVFGLALPRVLGEPVIERAMASLALENDGVAPVIDWQVAMRRQDRIDTQANDTQAHGG